MVFPSQLTLILRRRTKMVEPIFEYQFRLILIGDSTVGKSSLLKFFTDGKFAEVRISHFFLPHCAAQEAGGSLHRPTVRQCVKCDRVRSAGCSQRASDYIIK